MTTDVDDLRALLRRLAYREGTFKLSAGGVSDFFVDCKPVLLTGLGHRLAARVLVERLAVGPPVEAVAGVVLGGCPLASAVAVFGPYDAAYVRAEAKDHGTGRRVEGAADGRRVALLEDVATTGRSALRAVAALRDAGATVARVLVLVDRLEGAAEAFTAEGVPFEAVFTRDDFVGRGP